MEFLESLSPELRRVFVDVAAEYLRAFLAEGCSPSLDDGQEAGRLATAASCYALVAGIELRVAEDDGIPHNEVFGPGGPPPPKTWSMPDTVWKPHGPRRDIVRAIVMLCAELARMQRLGIDQAKT